MDIRRLEMEMDYDKNGTDRTWYDIHGIDYGTKIKLDGEYALTSDDTILNGDGERIDDGEGHEGIAVRNALTRSKAAATLGSIKTEKKAQSSRENGKKGGRPHLLYVEHTHRMRDGDKDGVYDGDKRIAYIDEDLDLSIESGYGKWRQSIIGAIKRAVNEEPEICVNGREFLKCNK